MERADVDSATREQRFALGKWKVYLSPENTEPSWPDETKVSARRACVGDRHGIKVPDEPIAGLGNERRDNTLGITVAPYGVRRFGDLFTRHKARILSFRIRDSRLWLGDVGWCVA